MANKIQLRRDTTVNWIAHDPVLAEGEPAVDMTTGQIRIGNGVLAWSSLPDISGAATSTSKVYVAAAAISESDLVYVIDQAGAVKADLATCASYSTLPVGYAANSAIEGGAVVVNFDGTTSSINLVPGAAVFMSSTPGQASAVPPNTPGAYVQRVGTALSATEYLFDKSLPVRLANV